MELVTVKIDEQEVQVEKGTTILEAAKKIGIQIPTLCHLKEINEIGACRVCVVEVEGARTLSASCVTPVGDGMAVHTTSPRVQHARKLNLELLLGDHDYSCPSCIRNLNCELQDVAQKIGIRDIRFAQKKSKYPKDRSTAALVRDPAKCILCRRCVSVCEKVQTVRAIVPLERGMKTVIGPAFHEALTDSECIQCGQCVLVCPTGALYEKENIDDVWSALGNKEKHVVVQTAPAIRVAIGEEFGCAPGQVSTGKLVAALRRLGFDKVFDTDFTADLTIMEEGSEFLKRLKGQGKLPLMTSCSPGWINFIETFYPDMLSHLSTCKSPQQMFGALAKTYYAEKAGIDPRDIVSVSIMPCVAKKFEAQRPEMRDSGYQDVDYVLTTRELARMIKQAGISFDQLPEEDYDAPLGISTGAGLIFGATGGVMEAALRTVYEIVTGEQLEEINFYQVRGLSGVKEATVRVGDSDVKVAVAHGISNARALMEKITSGAADYHFIEIMCCPGGCIGGGGQPIPTNREVREKRLAGIYQGDTGMQLRKSHQNPAVQMLYQEYLGEPLGEKSHHLLHTSYAPKNKF
ncbi:NADH-dependent [FeFe] hydrogenase, group A6 [Candidatus Formimonas warabiya]|uniref:Ferredoxin n=1 Tax=Formimonas warabiya TaxID=1761012 RepID=A0A3G1KQF6_FORW1|nr:NADH-dependent [FeFe] hydrogenase, group A6 [Candidatus Formimonas warabiya]ATW24667.1 ferredoxin [Candidatus Formimonas warabiya]